MVDVSQMSAMPEPTEELTLYGVTDGVTATGDFPLYADVIYASSTETEFRIPKGYQVELWGIKVTGDDETQVIVKYAHDGSTYKEIGRARLESAGELDEGDDRKPIVMRSLKGVETFKLSWSQAAEANAQVSCRATFSKN